MPVLMLGLYKAAPVAPARAVAMAAVVWNVLFQGAYSSALASALPAAEPPTINTLLLLGSKKA